MPDNATPEVVARRVCDEMFTRMQKMGLTTTAHYDAGLDLIADAVRGAKPAPPDPATSDRDKLVAWIDRGYATGFDPAQFDVPNRLDALTAKMDKLMSAQEDTAAAVKALTDAVAGLTGSVDAEVARNAATTAEKNQEITGLTAKVAELQAELAASGGSPELLAALADATKALTDAKAKVDGLDGTTPAVLPEVPVTDPNAPPA